MNISGVSSTHGSSSVNSVQGIEATESTAKTQAEGLSEVRDNVSLSVDAIQAAETVGDAPRSTFAETLLAPAFPGFGDDDLPTRV